MSDTKILVIGAGSIGRRHAANLSALGAQVGIYDVDTAALDDFCKDPRFTAVYDLAAALKDRQYTAAVVCTPNHLHIPAAQQVADAEINLFIEKPLSHTFDGVGSLIGTVNQKGLICMAGFNLRYEPGLQYIKEHLKPAEVAFARIEFGSYLPSWRPQADYRQSYSANRSMGGGIILDDVHEIDYACWLFGAPARITSACGTFGHMAIDVEDTAEFLLQYPDKLVNIHCDYLQRTYTRQCKICLKNGNTIEWVFGKQVTVHSDRPDTVFSYADRFDVNDMYVAEMREFLACLSEHRTPGSDLENAARILDIALGAKGNGALK
jgi:predicted dehydrogenase